MVPLLFALLAATLGFQTTAQPANANPAIVRMLQSGVPESAVISTIIGQARDGTAVFDISPEALIQLKQAGASEGVLDAMIVAQREIIPGRGIPAERGVFFESSAGRASLRPLLLWAPIVLRTVAFPIDRRHRAELTLDESTPALLINNSSPTLIVEGFSPGADWRLIRMDGRTVRLRRKSAFSSDFMSNAVFEDRDTVRATITPEASGDRFTVRPAAVLAAGVYTLCGQLQEGGWMRICYPFEVGASR